MVSPRAAIDGVTYFFPDNLLCHRHRPLQTDDLFTCRLVTTPTFRRRFSSVLSKFSQKKIYSGVIPVDDVTRGGPLPPPSSLVRSLRLSVCLFVKLMHGLWQNRRKFSATAELLVIRRIKVGIIYFDLWLWELKLVAVCSVCTLLKWIQCNFTCDILELTA